MDQDVFHPILPHTAPAVSYRKLTSDFVGKAEFDGVSVLTVAPQALKQVAAKAFKDMAHLLRASHLAQLRAILDDSESSDNDRFVASELLRNAVISAAGVLPMCQDTGTAIVLGWKGQQVWSSGNDAAALAAGIQKTYHEGNLRYSQMAPLSMFEEANTGDNLPAQIDIEAVSGDEYRFLFIAKGGGSANKTYLFQETKAILNPDALHRFLEEKMMGLGTAACPPYHLAIVVGGTSAEQTLKTVKLASTRFLDDLPSSGNAYGQAFRDRELENEVLQMSRNIGIGAQFGGKYFCHDVRIVRLPRHGASCPIGIGVSCAADRQALGRIGADGVYLEELERDPARFLPEVAPDSLTGHAVSIDLNRPTVEVLADLSRHPVKTRLNLNGTLVVARDVAHARIKQALDSGDGLPDFIREHPVYYAGPAKTPTGLATGSFGPTTSARMDSYVQPFQEAGGSLIMLGKGNRSRSVAESCKIHGGFYLGSVGGPGARLAQDCIRKVEPLAFSELGMEAVWQIEVENFPAFIVVDDKGNDFFASLQI